MARRPISYVYDEAFVKVAELGTKPDRLVIGMRGDDDDPFADRTALLEARQNSRAGTHAQAVPLSTQCKALVFSISITATR